MQKEIEYYLVKDGETLNLTVSKEGKEAIEKRTEVQKPTPEQYWMEEGFSFGPKATYDFVPKEQ